MMRILQNRRRLAEVVATVVFGVAARMSVATSGYNYDFESYVIVAQILKNGGNVYALTTRYNYGPVWFFVLHSLERISLLFSNPVMAFRFLIPAFLSLVDIALFAVIWRRYGRIPALLTFLSPIAIIITGYHGQFENFALLLGMLAVWRYESDTSTPGKSGITRARFEAYVLLGLSLMIKHVLFLFPVWLAFRERSWKAKAWALALPITVFLLGFVPYLADGRSGIVANVFFHRGFLNAPLWHVLVAPLASGLIAPMPLFLGALLLGGYWTRRQPPMDALLVYTLILVCFAPTMANQYLAIVAPAIAVFSNIFFLVYTVAASLMLVANKDGLHNVVLAPYVSYDAAAEAHYEIPITILFLGFVWMLWRRRGSAIRPDARFAQPM